MKKFKILLILSLLLTGGQLHAQDNIVADELAVIQKRVEKVERTNARLGRQLGIAEANIASLELSLQDANQSISKMSTELAAANNLITSTEAKLQGEIVGTASTSSRQYASLSETISKNMLYWALGAFGLVCLSGLLFFILRRKLTSDKFVLLEGLKLANTNLLSTVQRTEQGLLSDIDKTRQTLRDETLKIDSKLIELLEIQMNLLKEEQKAMLPQQQAEPDHSLALKVADEIVRIQKNLTNMDTDTKGLKQLSASVNRIKDNFEAKGYELVELLNKPYNEGLKLQPNFRPDESLKPGEQIITRIIKPQVNFNGVMIQTAQVEVSIGEEV